MSNTVALKRGARPRAAASRRSARPPAPRPRSAKRGLQLGPLAMSSDVVRLITRWGLGGLVVVAGVATFILTGMPQRIAWEAGSALGEAGFQVKHVDVTGVRHMARLPVYAAALDQPSNAMPLVDLSLIRARLLAQPWVADARVSRRLPDTIAIDVRERQPTALWQNQGVVRLVDSTGAVLEAVNANDWPDLPLIVGPDANEQTQALMALLDTAPALKAEMSDATWIGGRRWDIRFRSGETLALPEGRDAAQRALRLFARLDGTQGLLKRGFVRFDMRLPDKMVVRVSKEPGAQAVSNNKADNATPI